MAFVMINYSCQSNAQQKDDTEIVFQDDKGNKISLKDLEGATGSFNWELKSDTKVSKRAQRLHQESRALGQKGKYDEAITKLNNAHKIDPDWAYPIYDLAFTYLLKKDYDNALKYYKLTDEIEPRGFFAAKTAVWCLEKEKNGEISDGFYRDFIQLEWMENKDEVSLILKNIVEKYPTYAPAWEKYSGTLADHDERLKAIENGLVAKPDRVTKESLLINKAIVLDLKERTEESIKILGELILDQKTTLSHVPLAKFVLAGLVKK